MASVWRPENIYRTWLDVELVACEALANIGKIPMKSFNTIMERAGFDVVRIEEIEKTTKHDVIAFLTSVAEKVGEDSRFIHMGLTSSDVLDTSLAMLLREAAELLIHDVERVLIILREKAFTYKNTLSYGKIAGAVGTFSFIDPMVEEYVCGRLGLKPAPVSTQIVQRDRHAEFFTTLAIIASSIEKFATEIRHLQRSEVREAEEFFSPGQKGSSAMPHKRNPVLSENLTGLARLMRSYAVAALEDIPLWHERDISHSSVERVIGPDATILLDFMLSRFAGMIEKLTVYPERMMANLNMTKGLVFSQMVLLQLIEKGITRENAYAIVQRNAMESWQKGLEFKQLLLDDGEVMSFLTPDDLEETFRVENFLKHVNYIFIRVFGGDNEDTSVGNFIDSLDDLSRL